MPLTSIGIIGLYLVALFLAIYALEKLKISSILGFFLLGLLSQYVTPLPLEPVFPIISEIAVWLLFFFIGLEYSPEALAKMGRSLWRPALIDFIGNFAVPLGLFLMLRYPLSQALVLSAALYPSSTVIVARLLADTRRLASPEAELLIGILIFEDVVGVILLTLLGGTSHAPPSPQAILMLTGAFLGVFLVFFLLSRWGLHLIERMLTPFAEHPLNVFFTLGLVLCMGALGHISGLSGAMLTFLLGVLIPQEHPFHEATIRTLVPIKELTVGLFFFSIPSTLDITLLPVVNLIWLSVLGLILKGLSTYFGAWVYGLGPRGRYRAALSFLPKGEFSLLFAQMERALSTLIMGLVLVSGAMGTIFFLQAERLSRYLVPRGAKGAMQPRWQ